MPTNQFLRLDHPLAAHHLTRLRNKRTEPAEFRLCVQRVAMLLAAEATRDLRAEPVEFETPMARMTGRRLSERVGLVPILRAGLGLVEPLLALIPTAEVWHLGVYRDEETARPVEYYSKIPATSPLDVALVLDPMLATGGSICSALAALRQWGVPRLKVLALIASQEGIAAVQRQFPEVQIYVGDIDPGLDERKFIVPGLGDAGDRMFNTRPGGE